ncbi:hypothetical protein [Bradyrhizobium sp. RP6]|uniref:hypothetical protein n=1 Tax=Bradyrhizobium sp. RP6 TaxID=2489596 RepID=UPI000F537E9D|nr:hypothetical protein [Bradyrhizobium sp. RP6]RQH06876.1 hypothetical protein EHH60_30185 [Bradyrhizobium sp. RP6]
MAIDPRKFKADASRLAVQQKAKDWRGGRTGATDMISAALPAIKELREQGIAWSVIAAALAAQGAVQGIDRQPLTGRRLCALISAINKREERRERKRRSRYARRDLVPRARERAVTITPELQNEICRRTSAGFSEVDLRKEAFAELKSLLKEPRK